MYSAKNGHSLGKELTNRSSFVHMRSRVKLRVKMTHHKKRKIKRQMESESSQTATASVCSRRTRGTVAGTKLIKKHNVVNARCQITLSSVTPHHLRRRSDTGKQIDQQRVRRAARVCFRLRAQTTKRELITSSTERNSLDALAQRGRRSGMRTTRLRLDGIHRDAQPLPQVRRAQATQARREARRLPQPYR